MRDIILEKFFEKDRWIDAIDKGVFKDIRKSTLISLTMEGTRLRMAEMMRSGKYMIAPPHTAKIPKDNGEFRTVYVNEPIDRVVLGIANDLLFELMRDKIHPACKSYLKGIGCGRVVQEASREIVKRGDKGNIVGWKADLSKYFDSVPIRYIDKAFDMVEARFGKSALIDVLRKYYHTDYYFDENNDLQMGYQSLKQGCAVASWLADVLLYDIDKEFSRMDGYYVRYSDDILYIGNDPEGALQILAARLGEMDLKLNPKKVEMISPSRWFKFLGYSIKGDMISLSSTRIKTFQKEIEKRTIKDRKTTPKRAVNAVNRYLYKGNGEFSWATQVLSVCNVRKDINELNKFVMDCLRAVETGKRRLGGLGYVVEKPDGCIARGTGRNVRANRNKTSVRIEGYLTLGCMQNALITSRGVYNSLVNQL